MRTVIRTVAMSCLALVAACSSEKPPETPASLGAAPAPKHKSAMEMSGELGVLDIDKVDRVFGKLQNALSGCMDRGNKFAGGTVVYAIRVDHSGHVKWAYLKDTTLGDRTAEKCMLDVLRAATWPIPEGGEDGTAQKPFEFPDREERPAMEWTADHVLPSLKAARTKLDKCRAGNQAQFRATAIIEPSGAVAAVGVAPPDERSEETVDCLVEVVKRVKLPTPGSWPAKVSFDIP